MTICAVEIEPYRAATLAKYMPYAEIINLDIQYVKLSGYKLPKYHDILHAVNSIALTEELLIAN